MDQRNLISSLVFLLLAVSLLVASLGMGTGFPNNPQAGFMPFGVGLLMMVFSLVLFVMAFRTPSAAVSWADLWRTRNWPKNVMVAAALVVYMAVLPLAGFLIATFVLMTVLFRLNILKLRTAALGAAISVAFIYGLFHFILKTPLPRGMGGF